MRPKFAIPSPKQEDELPRHFYMGSPQWCWEEMGSWYYLICNSTRSAINFLRQLSTFQRKHKIVHSIFSCSMLWFKTTTSWKTLPRKTDLYYFKSLRVTHLTSLLLSIQSCSSKFWASSCIASNFDKGWRVDHKHKIWTAKIGTVQCLKYFSNCL